VSALAPDWLGAARAATDELRSALAAAPTSMAPPASPQAPTESTPPSPIARVKPRKLSIPAGYIGSLP